MKLYWSYTLKSKKYGLQKKGTWDTGLSDFHHLIYTQLKSRYSRLPPRKINYRCYNHFVENNFLTDLSLQITSSKIDEIESFGDKFVTVLDRNVPRKTRMVRGNEKPHVNRTPRKAIMERPRLDNIYFRTKLFSDMRAFHKQRNHVCNINIGKLRKSTSKRLLQILIILATIFGKFASPFFLISIPFQKRLS